MAKGGTFTRCPYCDRWVDTTGSDVVYAVKPHDIQAIGQTRAAFFHPRCPPEHVGYRRRPRPEK
jgi:hypothetical protein